MKASDLTERQLLLISPADRKRLGVMTAAEASEKQATRLERQLLGEIVQYLHLQGIEVLWCRTDKKSHATVGWPDLTLVKDGVPWGIEVKTAEGRVRVEQADTMRKMRANGWQTAVVRSFQQFHDLVFKGLE